MSNSKCKECGAEIIWLRTRSGKAMPCDAPQVMFRAKKGGRDRVITPDGEVLACEITDDAGRATGVGHIPHWSTCPSPGRFRR